MIPLRPGGKVPVWREWDRRATLDPAVVRSWWARAPYNVGISCRGAGLLVVDLDAGRPHGCQVLRELARAHGADDPRETYTVETPRGGQHRYFLAPEWPVLGNSVARLGVHVDTRGVGGFVTAAGSVRRTARGPRRYRVVRDGPVAPAPAWLVAALAPRQVSGPLLGPGVARVVSSGRRVRAYRAAVVSGEVERVREAAPGTRAHVVFTAACRLGELVGAGWLDEATAVSLLSAAAAVHDGVEGWGGREASRHIANGVALGRRRPRVLPERPVGASRADGGDELRSDNDRK
ncbi:hypothetical protein GCM10010185_28390 [Saccharothrix coeruleofusca]|uniref:DNA primase/polymerase bifunctional N-terminal domain-containing protein n=1 Tax=Saccharothrix coeruleofusca TaxID=33919 RepID=A0A918ANL7_9PSEU|nr:hypothetical protein GCM10010185_28390 [Saccharothrix coeruleofusca]